LVRQFPLRGEIEKRQQGIRAADSAFSAFGIRAGE
jgi:hypothetical protein